jgi:hypothetical protein
MFGRFRRQRGDRGGEDRTARKEESVEELAARATELSEVLGAAPVDEARLAAIERLTEMRAAGSISEEDFAREKRRLQAYGTGGTGGAQ